MAKFFRCDYCDTEIDTAKNGFTKGCKLEITFKKPEEYKSRRFIVYCTFRIASQGSDDDIEADLCRECLNKIISTGRVTV